MKLNLKILEKMGFCQSLARSSSQLVTLKRKSGRAIVTDVIMITMAMLMDLSYCIGREGGGGSGSLEGGRKN